MRRSVDMVNVFSVWILKAKRHSTRFFLVRACESSDQVLQDQGCSTVPVKFGWPGEAFRGRILAYALPLDAEMAARSYRSSFSTGLEAPFFLGELLEHSAPKVDQDSEEALVWYRLVHRRGQSGAGVSIAALLLDPSALDGARLCEEGARCAAEALLESIRTGSAHAIHYLEVLHSEGAPGLPANRTEARNLCMWSVCLALKDNARRVRFRSPNSEVGT
jgi:TPR repeat protein